MQFLKKSVWSFFTVIARGLGALAINKIFALYFGTSGITLLAHFQNLISIFTQIPNDGINRAIINQWANKNVADSRKQEVLSSGILLTAVSFSLIMIVVYIYRNFFIEPFIQYIKGPVFMILIIFSILAILLNAIIQSLILAEKRVKAYSILGMLSVGTLLLVLALSLQYKLLEIAFIAYALGNSISFLFSTIYFIRKMKIKVRLPEPTLPALKDILSFMAMALSVLIFGKLVDFYIRAEAIEWFGMVSTGQWQSLVKLSDAYVMIFVGTVGVVFFPEVSSRIDQKSDLIRYLNQVLMLVVPIIAVILLILYMLGEPILSLLFSEEFIPAYKLMHYQLTGDFFMMVSYLFAYILMAGKKTLTYVMLQLISAVVYVGIIFLLRESYDIESILIAHLTRHIVFFTILLFLIRKH